MNYVYFPKLRFRSLGRWFES